jgi:HPt (histidine-containing phosphotransfer) domain-containing protein
MTEPPVLEPAAVERLLRLGGADLVRQMIELYLRHGPERIAALAAGVAAGDAGQVERAAHTLKSTAGNLGAHRLQHTADALEAMAADGVVDEQMAARLSVEYDDSAAALRQLLEEYGS